MYSMDKLKNKRERINELIDNNVNETTMNEEYIEFYYDVLYYIYNEIENNIKNEDGENASELIDKIKKIIELSLH